MDIAVKTDYEDMKRLQRKDRIKNTMILFLVLMLILTLFSNTIMNYTLPEVSVMKLVPGVVSRSADVSVTVESNQDYTLLAEDAVEIKRVAVQKGQNVKAGQILFYLNSPEESMEVKDLRSAIDEAKLQYEKDLLEAGTDYFSENQQIQMARDALNAAIAARDQAASQSAASDTGSGISAAELNAQQNRLNRDRAALDSEQYETLSAESKEQIRAELDAFLNADARCSELTQALEQLEGNYSGDSAVTSSERELAELQLNLNRLREDHADSRQIEDAQIAVDYAAEDLNRLKEQKQSIELKRTEVQNASVSLSLARSALTPKLAALSNSIDEQLAALDQQYAASEMSESGKFDAADSAAENYDTMVNEARYALDSAIHALEAKVKSDKMTDRSKALDLEAAEKRIAEQEENLAKMLEKEGATEIVSPVDGLVEEIFGFAGARVESAEPMIQITLPEDGFQAVASVNNHIAETLTVGQEAKIIDQSDASAVIKNIAQNKTQKDASDITLELNGDMESGQQLNVQFSESSVQADNVIPKNAVKEDASGKFVYGVVARNTPIGNRYEAKKIPVTVLAEDDSKCSVSGEFGDAVDYIIVASSAPFVSGDKVKLSEE
ncbi:MAG TPA: hypothetical protein DCG49_05450 [Ruminococcus sp.]|nr:hypothetical protein [Ruminococcus sp.]